MAFTVLCPTDFSAPSDRALEYAVALARPHAGASIRLLHVDDLPTYGLPEGSVLDEPVRAGWREALAERVERFGDGVPIVPELGRGKPADEIVAHASGVDLVVMSTRGRNAVARALLGSVAHKVARSCPVPLLSIDPGAALRPIRNVLCMIDLSPGSARALEEAARWAERAGAGLHVLHVYELPMYTLPDGGSIFEADLAPRVRAQASAAIEALLAERPTRSPVRVHLVEGTPAAVADALIGDEAIDLVVMGTHGRSGAQRWLLGSVAERMLRTCHVPVMVVRDGGER